ncbi:MAG: DoxX family protein [Chloroflexota bacterium]
MNIALWIVQILLAIVFLGTGGVKLTRSKEKLDEMGIAHDFSLSTLRVIGLLEVLGGIGIILPFLTGILPWLTLLAAVGFVLTMIGAILTNIRFADYPKIGLNVVLLGLAVFVAYGRFALTPL